MIVGFIDFIVDPCFQVMGDMMEAIMRPLQENKDEPQSDTTAEDRRLSYYRSLQENKDEAQSQAAGATAAAAAANNNNHISSRSSSLSSRSSRRSTPSPINTRKSKRLSYHFYAVSCGRSKKSHYGSKLVCLSLRRLSIS